MKAPIYKASPVVPVASWTGCYVGGAVGYAWARDRDDEKAIATGAPSPFSPSSDASVSGVKLGGYLGCNCQMSAFVFGVEADGEWANLTGSADFSNTGTPPDHYDAGIDWQGSVRARLGYAFDRALLYATGGVAFAHINEHDVVGAIALSTDNASTRTGWTVGAGLDYAFTPQWIGRIEYRYADFGTFSYSPTVFAAFTENHKITEHAVRLGIAYKLF
jgi:outer membrane immunogenic protein